jgi:hypothetical protein
MEEPFLKGVALFTKAKGNPLYFTTLFIFTLSPSGCSFHKNETPISKEEVAIKEQRETDFKRLFSEENLYTSIKKNFKVEQFRDAESDLKTFFKMYPDSKLILELKEIEHIINDRHSQREADDIEEKRKVADKIDDYWELGRFKDEFDNPMNKYFLTTKENILGTFSNSATENSPLRIKIIVAGGKDISFQLYHYNQKSPLKQYGQKNFYFQVEDKDKKIHKFTGSMWDNDRVSIQKNQSEKLHKLLSIGQPLKFFITKGDSSVDQYKFLIKNSAGYTRLFNYL